jgi:hypothetical protein
MDDLLLGDFVPPPLPPGVSFDAERHLYYLDSAPIPGVTSILSRLRITTFEDVRQISARVAENLDRAAERGTLIHKMCAAIIGGTYRESDYPGLDNRATGLRNFLRRVNMRPRYVEHVVVSRRWRYGGTIDMQGPFNGAESIIDVKSGEDEKGYRLQTAGYDIAYCEQERKEPQRRYLLLLTGDVEGGRDGYRVVAHREASDLRVFPMALSLYNWVNTPKG